MADKPTYEQLEQRAKELENGVGNRKWAEKAVRESEEKFKAITASAKDAIIIMDNEGSISFWNEAAERIFGYSPREAMGKELHIFLAPQKYHEAYGRGIVTFNRTGHGPVVGKTLELEAVKKDGTIFPMELSVSAVKIKGKWHATGIVRDTTERKRAEKALREAHEQLERRVEERTAELSRANVDLKQEIAERKRAEEALRDSEREYSILVESSLTGIYIDQNGKIVFANNRFAEIYGYSRDELIGLESCKLVHPEDVALTDEIRAKRLKGEEAPLEYEARGLTKDGETIWIVRRNTRIEYKGRPAILGNIVDITSRAQSEEALRKSEAKLYSIFRAAPAGIGLVSNRVLKEVNDRICEMVGYSREELLEQNARILYPSDEDYEYVGRKKYAQIRERGIGTVETRWQRKDGEVINVLLSSSAVDPNDLTRRVTFTALDITERKWAEKKLRERKEALKAQALSLEELNTALKVLLRRREEDKAELEENVVGNVKELVLPYVETLRNTRLDAKQMAYTSIIESLLNDIVSPFLRSLSSKYTGFTPREIQVAALVKEGKTNKEIAELLNVSARAVESHRENIRAKFGLKHQPVNLRSYLLSL